MAGNHERNDKRGRYTHRQVDFFLTCSIKKAEPKINFQSEKTGTCHIKMMRSLNPLLKPSELQKENTILKQKYGTDNSQRFIGKPWIK